MSKAERQHRYYLKNKDRLNADPARRRASKNAAHRKLYGIDLNERDALLAAQLNRCAICGTTEPNGRGWHTDHVELPTGAPHVRGILCHNCNTMIGLAKHDISILHSAAKYLQHTEIDYR